jgi:CHAT domain-containing protein
VQPAALKNVQADLKTDEVLLEYVLDDPKSFCISVTHGAAHVLTLPAGRKQIEELTHQFVDEVHAKRTGVEASKQLFGLLLGSVPEASAANRIIIAPDGVLNLLPFEALRDATGEYLLKSHVISYVPSGTVLDVLSRVEHHERAPPALFGDRRCCLRKPRSCG